MLIHGIRDIIFRMQLQVTVTLSLVMNCTKFRCTLSLNFLQLYLTIAKTKSVTKTNKANFVPFHIAVENLKVDYRVFFIDYLDRHRMPKYGKFKLFICHNHRSNHNKEIIKNAIALNYDCYLFVFYCSRTLAFFLIIASNLKYK